MIWSNLGALVEFAKRRAERWVYDGIVSPHSRAMLDRCTHTFRVDPEITAILIFTRDTGHHSSGWWKNPDYERCRHLSLFYRLSRTWASVPHDKDRSARFCEAFFDADRRLLWAEGPYSPEGKLRDVWHYRLFCDPAWAPILPRGEVYSRELTEAGWKSYSDIHGDVPPKPDAPWLLEAQ